jgi:hypothetical protein
VHGVLPGHCLLLRKRAGGLWVRIGAWVLAAGCAREELSRDGVAMWGFSGIM